MRTTLICLLALGCKELPAPGVPPGTDTSAPPITQPTPTTPTAPCPEGVEHTDTVPSFCGAVPKNVLFLSIDTFRKDHLGRYGETRGLTPFLDGLLEDSFVLDDHLQCSNWTFASTTCTLLGRYNAEAGFMAKLAEVYKVPVETGTPFLASWLHDAGYYNILVSANSWLGPAWGNDQGYDLAFQSGPRVPGVWAKGKAQLEQALAAGLADKWFLHLHFLDPHSPYNAPLLYTPGYDDLPPVDYDLRTFAEHYDAIGDWHQMPEEERALVEQHLRVLYAGEIAYLDKLLAEMWAELDALGWLDDTLVVVWTDHGEAFWEHGFATHAHVLHAEENGGVAFFWAKNIVPGGWSGPTSAIDLAPTVLELLDVPRPPEITGLPVGQAPPDRPIFGTAYARNGVVQSVRQENLKLQFRWKTGLVWLSDLEADPLEQTNLYDPSAPSPEALALWDELLPMIELTEPLAPEKTVTWPPELPSGR